VKIDIDSHQYIPGVFPRMPRGFYEVSHHSTHHFGHIEPYGFGINVDQPNVSEETKKRFSELPDELKNALELDEQLTGYQWDNPKHRWFLDLIDKYQDIKVDQPNVSEHTKKRFQVLPGEIKSTAEVPAAQAARPD